MRHRPLVLGLLLLALAALAALAGCGDTYNAPKNAPTTVNIYGPFSQCTAIVLPNGRVVSFGDQGVSITGNSSISVGGVNYTIDFSSCNAVTITNPEPEPKPKA